MVTTSRVRRGASEHIPTTALVVTGSFGPGLPASRVADAIARGLQAGGVPADRCPIAPGEVRCGKLGALLDAQHFDTRMHRSRAVVLAERRLKESTLAGSTTFEIATRARQAGVPAYAVTGENRLDRFDARILDLQAILEAKSTRALAAAGRRLASLV